jgi:Zn finger protein HypA/HybF involved in hydrogenase expression
MSVRPHESGRLNLDEPQPVEVHCFKCRQPFPTLNPKVAKYCSTCRKARKVLDDQVRYLKTRVTF